MAIIPSISEFNVAGVGLDVNIGSSSFNDVGKCADELYGVNSPKNLSITTQELETIVNIAQQSEIKTKGVTAKSIKELSDRLEMFKAKAVLDSEVCEALTALLSLHPKWSEIADEETRSEIASVFLDLGENQSVRVRDERQTTIVAESKGVGINDEGNRAVLNRNADYEQVDLVSNQEGDVMSQKATESGPFGKNFRGGFHGRGRGVRGGRGTYRQESRSWANVASASVRSEVKLQYFPPKLSQEKIVVEMPPSSPLAKWEACLVRYFIDKRLPYTLVSNSAFNMWRNKGLLEVKMNDDGFAFFMFENKDCCRNILDGGPWIASAVGTPLFMDQLTTSGNRISFARVCVNIQADSLFPDSFSITSEGDSIEIRVKYQGVPSRCAHCNVFGHETKQCLSAQVSKLIELQKETENLSGKEVGWTTVKNKGKRKVGEPSQEMESVAPIEVSSSSNVGRVDSGKDCVNTYLEDVVTTTDSTVDIVTKEVASLEDEITTKATTQVEAFHSDIMDITNLIFPATEIILKEVESKGEKLGFQLLMFYKHVSLEFLFELPDLVFESPELCSLFKPSENGRVSLTVENQNGSVVESMAVRVRVGVGVEGFESHDSRFCFPGLANILLQ
ncbi:hypothetical protein ACSBR2_012643 [Camellia fascicularis]